jgi:hypothetical protein
MATPGATNHSRSTTPTELVRPEHKPDARKRCAKCDGLITGQFVRIPTMDGNNRFHVDCFTCAVSIPGDGGLISQESPRAGTNPTPRIAERRLPANFCPLMTSSSARRTTSGGSICYAATAVAH